MTLNKLIQIAGVIDQEEADLLLASGVQLLGFPLRLPVNKPDLTEEAAATIIRSLKPPACGVVITYLNQGEEIVAFCRDLGASVVQLHGDIDIVELSHIKEHCPQLMIFKSLVVGLHTQQELLELVSCTAPYVDAYITDTFDPLSGATGATGKTHDWAVSRELVLCSPRPVILAGGLTADNVYDAILAVRPAGVDTHTGVEDESGRKSREKVGRFVSEAQRAFRFIDNNT